MKTKHLIALAVAVVALVVPASASAALPSTTVTATDWDVRHSWVDYVTNPAWYAWFGQGTQTRTGGAVADTGYGSKTYSGWATNHYGTQFAASDTTTAGVRTVQLTGGLKYVVTPHSIDVRLTDIKVVKEVSGREHVVLDAYYKPTSGSPVTVNDLDFADLVDTPGGTTNELRLTSGGATVFNGGSNGSYAANDPFGRLAY